MSDIEQFVHLMGLFATAPSASARRSLIERHPELLLPQGDALLGQMVDFARQMGDSQAVAALEEQRELLRHWRDQGHTMESLPPEAEARARQAQDPDVPPEFAAEHHQIAVLFQSLPTNAAMREHCIELVRQLLSDVGDRYPTFRAGMLVILGIAYRHNKSSSDLRQAIRCYEQALNMIPKSASHGLYADCCSNMGTAYADLPGDDHQDNLRRAIACYERALEINTFDASPLAYARDMCNMATAYTEMPGVEAAEAAMRCLQEASRVYTPERFPTEYARLQLAMGDVYKATGSGDDEDDLRRAVVSYEQALAAVSPGSSPFEYAQANLGLGRSYTLLAKKVQPALLTKAIACLEQALQVFTPDGTPLDYVRAQSSLGAAYGEMSGEQMAMGRRRAVDCYEAALRVVTPQLSAEEYAKTTFALAAALHVQHSRDEAGPEVLRRIISLYEDALRYSGSFVDPEYRRAALVGLSGASFQLSKLEDKLKHLRRAVECQEEVAQLCSPQADPGVYASTLQDLGSLYLELGETEGSLTFSQERARSCFDEALRYVGPTSHPEIYGKVLMHFALAQEGMEAVELLRKALEVFTPEKDPGHYSLVMHNLGNRYGYAPSGDLGADQHRAIECYREALRFRSLESTPYDYALTMLALGATYTEYTLGDREENLRLAIECFENALRYFTAENAPSEFAELMSNLGNAYSLQAPEDKRAIACYTEALAKLSVDTDPRTVALICLSQGISLSRLGKMAEAKESLERALELIDSEGAPLDYALVQMNLGSFHADLCQGDSWIGAEQAITCYTDALRFFTTTVEPTKCAHTALMLGNTHFRERRWEEAHAAYALGIEAFDAVYRASASEASRLSALEHTSELYANDAYCIAQLGDFRQAVERIEQGRTRVITESLDRDRANLEGVNEQDLADFVAVGRCIRVLEAEARAKGSVAPAKQQSNRSFSEVSTDLAAARGDLDEVIERIRAYKPDFMPQIPGYDAIVANSDSACPLIYLITTSLGSLAVIVAAGMSERPEDSVVWLDEFTSAEIDRLLFWHGPTGSANNEMVGGLLGGQISGNQDSLIEELDLALPVLRDRLMGPLAARLEQLGVVQVMLVTSGPLALLPLHAVCPGQIVVRYIPSARMLGFATSALADCSSRLDLLLGVADPSPNSQPLNFARAEIYEVAQWFAKDARRLLFGEEATRAALIRATDGASHVHFACHGIFGEKEPLDSSLLLADGDRLTLRDLIDGAFDFSKVRVAVLSACQTGIIDVDKVPNETLGFPTGLLFAGVPAIISTLWPVDDMSTALLMGRFYQELSIGDTDVPSALHHAQTWLRTATAGEMGLADRYSQLFQESEGQDQFAFRQMRYFRVHKEEQPFSHPYYWAAFAFTGVS